MAETKTQATTPNGGAGTPDAGETKKAKRSDRPRIGVWLDPAVHEQVVRLADAAGQSLTDFAEAALVYYVAHHRDVVREQLRAKLAALDAEAAKEEVK